MQRSGAIIDAALFGISEARGARTSSCSQRRRPASRHDAFRHRAPSATAMGCRAVRLRYWMRYRGFGCPRAPIQLFMESIVALGRASFRPTSSVAKLSARGDDFPPDCLLAGIRQSPSSSPRAHTALEDKEKLARHSGKVVLSSHPGPRRRHQGWSKFKTRPAAPSTCARSRRQASSGSCFPTASRISQCSCWDCR